ncbi:hypothetical protein PTKIN_Ptkin16aG0028900 [Pterospermum kingtungense]
METAALRIALCEPLDSARLYLSRATLVVSSNLVDHWKTQIQKHVSAEAVPNMRSALMQVHWLRPVILGDGHTLGASLNLTRKLQMAISLTASNSWLLTGMPSHNNTQ